jgi:hypothetical protein
VRILGGVAYVGGGGRFQFFLGPKKNLLQFNLWVKAVEKHYRDSNTPCLNMDEFHLTVVLHIQIFFLGNTVVHVERVNFRIIALSDLGQEMLWVAVIYGTVSSIHTLDTIFHAVELADDFNIGVERFAAIDFITTREHFERVIRYSRHTI